MRVSYFRMRDKLSFLEREICCSSTFGIAGPSRIGSQRSVKSQSSVCFGKFRSRLSRHFDIAFVDCPIIRESENSDRSESPLKDQNEESSDLFQMLSWRICDCWRFRNAFSINQRNTVDLLNLELLDYAGADRSTMCDRVMSSTNSRWLYTHQHKKWKTIYID